MRVAGGASASPSPPTGTWRGAAGESQGDLESQIKCGGRYSPTE